MVLAGGQSHDPSSPQADPRGFDLRVPDNTEPPVCSWAGLGKVLLRWARGGPFQYHRGTDPLPSQSLQTSGRMAALWSCPTLGTSWVRQRRHSAVLNTAAPVTPGRSSVAQLSDDRMQLKGEALTDQ